MLGDVLGMVKGLGSIRGTMGNHWIFYVQWDSLRGLFSSGLRVECLGVYIGFDLELGGSLVVVKGLVRWWRVFG